MMAFTIAERSPSPNLLTRFSDRKLVGLDVGFSDDSDENDGSASGLGDSSSESSCAIDATSPMSGGKTSVPHSFKGKVHLETIEAVFSKARNTIKAPEMVSSCMEKISRNFDIDAWMENQFRVDCSGKHSTQILGDEVQSKVGLNYETWNVMSPKKGGIISNSELDLCNEKDDDLIDCLRISLSLSSKRRALGGEDEVARALEGKDELSLDEVRTLQANRDVTPSTGRDLVSDTLMGVGKKSAHEGKQQSIDVFSHMLNNATDLGAILQDIAILPSISQVTHPATCPSAQGGIEINAKTAHTPRPPMTAQEPSPKITSKADSGPDGYGVTNKSKLFASSKKQDCFDSVEPQKYIDHLTKKSVARLQSLSRPLVWHLPLNSRKSSQCFLSQQEEIFCRILDLLSNRIYGVNNNALLFGITLKAAQNTSGSPLSQRKQR